MASIDELNRRREAAHAALLQQSGKDSAAYETAWREWLAARENFNDALDQLPMSERLRWEGRTDKPVATVVGRQRPVERVVRQRAFGSLPIAASIIAVIVGALGGYLGASSRWFAEGVGAISKLDNTDLANALSELPSGETKLLTSGRVELLATFRREDEVCRLIVVTEQKRKSDMVACWQDDSWNIAFAAAEPPIGEGEYVPASGESLADTYLARAGIGPPLTRSAEEAALAIVGR